MIAKVAVAEHNNIQGPSGFSIKASTITSSVISSVHRNSHLGYEI